MIKNNFFKKIKKDNMTSYYFIILIFILFIIKTPILYYLTNFEKIITIKDKYTRYRKSTSNYNITDTDGNVYKIGNLWIKFDFNRGNDYAKVDIGKTYKVKGYGFRAGFLNTYENIYELEEV